MGRLCQKDYFWTIFCWKVVGKSSAEGMRFVWKFTETERSVDAVSVDNLKLICRPGCERDGLPAHHGPIVSCASA
jgi:hypothetical protein